MMNRAKAIAKYSCLTFLILFLLIQVRPCMLGCISAPFGYLDCKFFGADVSDAMSLFSWTLALPTLISFLFSCVALTVLFGNVLYVSLFKN